MVTYSFQRLNLFDDLVNFRLVFVSVQSEVNKGFDSVILYHFILFHNLSSFGFQTDLIPENNISGLSTTLFFC